MRSLSSIWDAMGTQCSSWTTGVIPGDFLVSVSSVAWMYIFVMVNVGVKGERAVKKDAEGANISGGGDRYGIYDIRHRSLGM